VRSSRGSISNIPPEAPRYASSKISTRTSTINARGVVSWLAVHLIVAIGNSSPSSLRALSSDLGSPVEIVIHR
jgi:hypothetical protein